MNATELNLAIATVPPQKADAARLNDPTKALEDGTVFPELTLPFFAADSLSSPEDRHHHESECEKKLHEIMSVSFVLDDLNLYLDTHCKDEAILAVFEQHQKTREKLTEQFARDFYPLSRHDIPYKEEHGQHFTWLEGPAPWEGECI